MHGPVCHIQERALTTFRDQIRNFGQSFRRILLRPVLTIRNSRLPCALPFVFATQNTASSHFRIPSLTRRCVAFSAIGFALLCVFAGGRSRESSSGRRLSQPEHCPGSVAVRLSNTSPEVEAASGTDAETTAMACGTHSPETNSVSTRVQSNRLSRGWLPLSDPRVMRRFVTPGPNRLCRGKAKRRFSAPAPANGNSSSDESGESSAKNRTLFSPAIRALQRLWTNQRQIAARAARDQIKFTLL